MKRIYMIATLACSLLLCSASCSKLGEEHEEARNLKVMDIDFTTLKEGEYIGYYKGGMYLWRENECKVKVNILEVANIELLSSKAEYTREFLDTLYQRVIDKQSLQIDAISGSTLDSKACLKAVENALIKAMQ